MINVYYNNKKYQIKSKQTLQEFLCTHKPPQLHFAIAINNQFIPRSSYNKTLLYESDQIIIIVPMQGG